MAQAGKIRAGIGGWTFEPWRGVFYPKGLKHADELSYAASHLTAIEINGTYYRTQTPATFAKWSADTPDDFVFAVKALRFTTNRRVLAEAGESVGKFLNQGVVDQISWWKGEPRWMSDMRQRSLRTFDRKPMAEWTRLGLRPAVAVPAEAQCAVVAPDGMAGARALQHACVKEPV